MGRVMSQSENHQTKQLGLVWIDSPYPIVTTGLSRILDEDAHIHAGKQPPVEGEPSSVVFCADGIEGLSEEIARIRDLDIEAPIVVFNLNVDLEVARTALRLGAQGFIHAGMQPSQIVRALFVAARGEVVAPRELLEHLIVDRTPTSLVELTARQQEILDLVVEGLSNAQIAGRLSLSESAIKQHLRAAYRTLGVSNRTEAARLIQQKSRN